ncbi:Cation/H(+) antiporter 8 [Glycine max]|nr:Cation/H(+) antiporter 8 [Glycine max]
MLVLLASYATHRIGLFALFGPFVLGLATPEGPPLGTAITKKIDSFVNWVLMPTFVTTCAMRVDLRDFMNWREKMNGGIGTLPPLCSNMQRRGRNGWILFGKRCHGMPDNVFSLAMVCIILNATAMSMLLTHLYDPMKRYASNYDDIYTLALTKFTSLIVLPFHKKWSYDGNCVEIEDETLRELNFRVMERAPCSVALFFAKRITKNPNVRLTVVRFLALSVELNTKDWQGMLDTEILNDIKEKKKVGEAYLNYIEKSVKDGPDTALCSEYPELWVLEDLLASIDDVGKASVFIMQQQRREQTRMLE